MFSFTQIRFSLSLGTLATMLLGASLALENVACGAAPEGGRESVEAASLTHADEADAGPAKDQAHALSGESLDSPTANDDSPPSNDEGTPVAGGGGGDAVPPTGPQGAPLQHRQQ